jgi:hypothetical protein
MSHNPFGEGEETTNHLEENISNNTNDSSRLSSNPFVEVAPILSSQLPPPQEATLTAQTSMSSLPVPLAPERVVVSPVVNSLTGSNCILVS